MMEKINEYSKKYKKIKQLKEINNKAILNMFKEAVEISVKNINKFRNTSYSEYEKKRIPHKRRKKLNKNGIFWVQHKYAGKRKYIFR